MFDPVRICRILNGEHVDYVIVGGFAAVVSGSSLPTRDINIVPFRSSDNLDRLGRASGRMGRSALMVVVASLDDIIDPKRSANRPKDLMALPYLESLRDEINNI